MSIADCTEQMPKAKGGNFMGCLIICDLASYQMTNWATQVVLWQSILGNMDLIYGIRVINQLKGLERNNS